MKLKKDLLLRRVAGTWVVVPVRKLSVSFNGMVTLNDAGALLWRALEQGGDENALTAALQKEYDVDRDTAAKDIEAFLEKLRGAGFLEEER